MPDDKAKDLAAQAKPMTAEEAAKRVKRTVTELVDGKEVAVKAAELLALRDYGIHVVVVTRDGQKFSSAE